MDAFSASELRKLTVQRPGPCVTLFMPTHAAGPAGQQDALRLKNLLGQAERGLVEQGVRSPDARRLLEPVRALPNEPGFWEKRSLGLALFVTEGLFDRFRLPIQLDEAVVVNRRFQIKPLLPLLNTRDRFHLLALSQNRVRLLEGRQFSIRAVSVEGLPENMAQALNYDQMQRSTQVHSGQRGSESGKHGAVVHGQGGERDATKEDLARYFRQVDAAVHPVLRESQTPLILAGVQYLLPIYREVSSYPHIAREGLLGSPDHLSDQELHSQAWPVVQGWETTRRGEAADRYRQLAGTGRTADHLEQVLPSACQGQVDVLFVDRDAHRWGSYDEATGQVTLNGQPHPGADDLLDLAAMQTLLGRGTIYAVPAEECPAPPVCAILRY